MPYTSGILIGIGETREERIDSLLALRDLHSQYGHLQACPSKIHPWSSMHCPRCDICLFPCGCVQDGLYIVFKRRMSCWLESLPPFSLCQCMPLTIWIQ